MLRVGFIGSGLIAWAHGLSLKALIDGGVVEAEIVAVHDRSERRARGFADVVGGDDIDVVADAAEVARRSDAIWVCTPTSAHRAAVDEALAAGRAVFCEKPLDVDLRRATELVEAVNAAGVPSQSGLVLRSAPVFRALRDLVQGGTLGAPMAAVFRDDQYFPIQGTYASRWRADATQAGGGCLIEHSIHDLDILRYCFGDVASVVARTANHAGHPGIEDTAAVTLSFASGFEAQLTSIWHDILSRGLDAPARGLLPRGHGVVGRRCPRPASRADQRGHRGPGLPIAALGGRAPVGRRRGRPRCARLRRGRPRLPRCGRRGRPPEPGLDVALEAHRLVDAAYRSAAQDGAPIGVSSTRG